MTEWQAAILNVQLGKMDEQIDRRMKNANYLNLRLKEISCIRIMTPDDSVTRNAYHLFIFKYSNEQCKGLKRELFLKALSAEGIPCAPGYVPLYKQKYLNSPEFRRASDCSVNYEDICLDTAEKLSYKQGVWLTQNLLLGSEKDMDDIAEAIIKIYSGVDELL